MRKVRQLLAIGAIVGLVAVNFQSALGEISSVRQIPSTDGPFFAEWESRFDPIREDIPFSQGVIGYAADWDVAGAEYSPADAGAEHILTQYSLAPLVVARDTDRDWIIVNMSASEFETWLASQDGEFAVTRYKKNLYLLQRMP